ncbi:hypothetical protein L484_016546 [Morus notabilis]|uniref:Uncharacterized protein n=1 Tax=Morus notabilis TaxID=981085 RepID=W9QK52_9ROSA|nr:uncharacterized protein LOC21399590 [Morus notabilis]EXB39077.1 hypothetical protein L484_016546 [Morus notabilis]
MAEAEKGSDIGDALKPFFLRASEAEERLSRLEAAIANAGNEELLKIISELQSKLESANAELVSEREKARNLAAENAKLQYRIKHLVLAVKEADHKVEQAK